MLKCQKKHFFDCEVQTKRKAARLWKGRKDGHEMSLVSANQNQNLK